MKDQKFGPLPILSLTVGGGLIGFLLRMLMLGEHTWAFPALSVLSVLVLGGIVYLGLGMGKRSSLSENLPKSIPAAIGTGVGALLLGTYFLASFPGATDLFHIITCALGVAGSAGLLVLAGLRSKGKFSSTAAMVMTLALAANLIHRFRGWSTDPLLGDYCFRLMACIFSMLAAFHLGGFGLERGQRQMTICFSMAAVYFSLICLADKDFLLKLYFGGISLWMLFGSCNLNKPIPPRRKPGGGYVDPQPCDTKESTPEEEI